MNFNRTPYIGFGILYAPKTLINNGHIIINFLLWEINITWGSLGK